MAKEYYIPYFTYEELACKQTGQIVLAEGFAEKLIKLRTKFNKPMPITLACRSKEYNNKIGGVLNSFHIYDRPRYKFTRTCTVDVATEDSTDKGDLITLAWKLGWAVGIHKNFIHLDRRTDYTAFKAIIFLY